MYDSLTDTPVERSVLRFRTQNFQHLAIRFCGGLVRWKSRIVIALGFSLCQSVHMSGVWIHTAATNTITLHLALDPDIKPLTFLCFSISAPPTYLAADSIMRSEHAQQRRFERSHHRHERMKRRRT